MTIELYYIIFFLLILVYIISCRFGYKKMVNFLSSHKEIKTASDIDNMTNMAKIQRSLIFFTIPFGGGAILLYLYYGLAGLLQNVDLIIMVGLIVINFIFSKKAKSIEKIISELPTANEELEEKKKHIVHVWQKTLFGKF